MENPLENPVKTKISTKQLPPCFPLAGQTLGHSLLDKRALTHCFLYLHTLLVTSHNLFEDFLNW